jgi:hypothetical protein
LKLGKMDTTVFFFFLKLMILLIKSLFFVKLPKIIVNQWTN